MHFQIWFYHVFSILTLLFLLDISCFKLKFSFIIVLCMLFIEIVFIDSICIPPYIVYLCINYFCALLPKLCLIITKNELQRRPRVSARDLLGPVI